MDAPAYEDWETAPQTPAMEDRMTKKSRSGRWVSRFHVPAILGRRIEWNSGRV
jgi:hypothetical protein